MYFAHTHTERSKNDFYKLYVEKHVTTIDEVVYVQTETCNFFQIKPRYE